MRRRPSSMEACTKWTACPPGTFVNFTGSPSHDRSCIACPPRTHTTTSDATVCIPHRSCTPGQYSHGAVNASSDGECRACPAGTYRGAAQSTCVPQTQCKPGLLGTRGTATTDQMCKFHFAVFKWDV